MKRLHRSALAVATAALLSGAAAGAGQADELTLCWAAWDPANALVELSKDFTAATGTTMKFDSCRGRATPTAS